jgi:hypothetical protein
MSAMKSILYGELDVRFSLTTTKTTLTFISSHLYSVLLSMKLHSNCAQNGLTKSVSR